MKKIYCKKCGSWTDSFDEIIIFETGDFDNRCPICGNFDCLVLKKEDIKE